MIGRGAGHLRSHIRAQPWPADEPATDPALLSAQHLQELLGLTADELLAILAADPLSIVSGELDHRPELAILLDLLHEAEDKAGAGVLRRWVRSAGPAGRPIDLLLARDFAAFEDALATLAQRGYVISRAPGGARPATGP